ncbi:MAG: hypothetical protein P4L61_02125 [Candidatus Pacebacteria bacterium]|nr:hypothetical protein [Candidatus Paceibacterota bacterium]
MNIYGNALVHFSLTAILAVLALAAIWEVIFFFFKSKKRQHASKALSLIRSSSNPIISPDRNRIWELEGTFNPGAILDDDGRIHLFYRAIGSDGLSRVGHAESKDGVHFDYRSLYPVFQPMTGYGLPDPRMFHGPMTYDPTFYTSGGGWGGAEDPRTVRIDGRIYLTYVAFEGWEHLHMAVTSISEDDFRKRRWNWKQPVLISKQRSKNWVLFPEKFNGKFAIIHGVVDKVMIEYVKNLEDVPRIKSLPNRDGQPGYKAESRKGYWDYYTRGAGSPPVRTDKGWLLFYNVVSHMDPGKYKIGAMLLDLKDPSIIKYRSPQPILEPDMSYENDGKPGVVYASGAVIKDGTVYLYYGAGDRHIGLATIPLSQLIEWLIRYGKV